MDLDALSVAMLAAKSGDASVVPVPPATAAGAPFPTLYPARHSVSGNQGCAHQRRTLQVHPTYCSSNQIQNLILSSNWD